MLTRLFLAVVLGLGLLAPSATLAAADHGAAEPHGASQAAGETHGAADAHGEKPSLLPDPTSRETQLQALWVIIIFVVLLAILYPTAWKQVLAGLKLREQRIRKDIADAEAARAKAEATLRQYSEQLATAEAKVREMLAGAVADGEKLAASIRVKAQEEAEESKQRAAREIDSAKKQAISEIYASAADISTRIAEKILRRNINVDDQRDLVRQSLEQIETLGARR